MIKRIMKRKTIMIITICTWLMCFVLIGVLFCKSIKPQLAYAIGALIAGVLYPCIIDSFKDNVNVKEWEDFRKNLLSSPKKELRKEIKYTDNISVEARTFYNIHGKLHELHGYQFCLYHTKEYLPDGMRHTLSKIIELSTGYLVNDFGWFYSDEDAIGYLNKIPLKKLRRAINKARSEMGFAVNQFKII